MVKNTLIWTVLILHLLVLAGTADAVVASVECGLNEITCNAQTVLPTCISDSFNCSWNPTCLESEILDRCQDRNFNYINTCGSTTLLVASETGIIASPNYPGRETTPTSCTWTIRAQPGYVIFLNVSGYDITSTGGSITVKDGVTSRELLHLTGTSLQAIEEETIAQIVDITFNSAGNDAFLIQYSQKFTPACLSGLADKYIGIETPDDFYYYIKHNSDGLNSEDAFCNSDTSVILNRKAEYGITSKIQFTLNSLGFDFKGASAVTLQIRFLDNSQSDFTIPLAANSLTEFVTVDVMAALPELATFEINRILIGVDRSNWGPGPFELRNVCGKACQGCLGQEVFNFCGSHCDRTCDNQNPTCSEECVPRCQCSVDRPILASNNEHRDNPVCVMAAECPVCFGDQVFGACASCVKTCNDPTPVCPLPCVPGCQCPDSMPLLLNPDDQDKLPMCIATNKCAECPLGSIQHLITSQPNNFRIKINNNRNGANFSDGLCSAVGNTDALLSIEMFRSGMFIIKLSTAPRSFTLLDFSFEFNGGDKARDVGVELNIGLDTRVFTIPIPTAARNTFYRVNLTDMGILPLHQVSRIRISLPPGKRSRPYRLRNICGTACAITNV